MSFLVSCDPDFDDIIAPQENVLFVLTSDWAGSASYSVIDLTTLQCYNDLGAGMVHTDAVVRAGADRLFVLNRRGRDNLQILDPFSGYAPISETSLRRNECLRPNPHDIALQGSQAWISCYDDTLLRRVDLATGAALGNIDLSALAPASASGIPCMDSLYLDAASGFLFVSLQRLNRASWTADEHSSVAIVDTSVNSLIREVPLTWDGGTENGKNAYSHFRRVAATVWQPAVADGDDHLFVSCVGSFRLLQPAAGADGGIVAVRLAADPAQISCNGLVASEAQLGGDIVDFVLTADGNSLYAVLMHGDFSTSLVHYDMSTSTVTRTLARTDGSEGYLWRLELDSLGRLFVCDRSARAPGIRVYDTADNDRPLHGDRPLYCGLPPTDLVLREKP